MKPFKTERLKEKEDLFKIPTKAFLGFSKKKQKKIFDSIQLELNYGEQKILKAYSLEIFKFSQLHGFRCTAHTRWFLNKLFKLVKNHWEIKVKFGNWSLMSEIQKEDEIRLALHFRDFGLMLLKSSDSMYELKKAYKFVDEVLLNSLNKVLASCEFPHAVEDVAVNFVNASNEAFREKSAIFIQRAFRGHLYRKQNKNKKIKIPNEDKWPCKEMVLKLKKVIPQKDPVPIKYLSWVQKEEKISKVSDKNKGLCKKIAKFLEFVDHDTFLKSLEKVVKQFNETLHSLPEDQRSFVILIPKASYDAKVKDGIPLKSNAWMTLLALDFLACPPMGIIAFSGDNPCYLENTLKTKYPGVQNVLLIDDGIYSGWQMNGVMESFDLDIKLRVFLLAPYYMNKGIQRVFNFLGYTDDVSQALYKNTYIPLLGERMLSAKELMNRCLWTKSELDALKELYNFDGGPEFGHNLSGVYFQHKLADEKSNLFACTSSTYYNGSQSEVLRFMNSLIPQVPRPPYK